MQIHIQFDSILIFGYFLAKSFFGIGKMNVNELNNCFKKWNPMETDYMNADFNQYNTGPGANLQKELQPAGQALQNGSGKKAVPTLVFKQLPKEMTKHALRNMCSKHGKVREVRDSTKNSYYFVDMCTVG